MHTNVTFRHFTGQHPDLHDSAIALAESFNKYHDGIMSTTVEFINENPKTVEITANVPGTTLVAKNTGEDFHKSLHEAGSKIVRQIQKYKTKTISSRTDKIELEETLE